MTPAKAPEAAKEEEAPVALPETINWSSATLVRTGGFTSSPPPEWAVVAVQKSYDDYKADLAAGAPKKPALSSTFADEKQAKAVLHQLRRAATSLNLGIAANVDGAVLTFTAKDKKVVKPREEASTEAVAS